MDASSENDAAHSMLMHVQQHTRVPLLSFRIIDVRCSEKCGNYESTHVRLVSMSRRSAMNSCGKQRNNDDSTMQLMSGVPTQRQQRDAESSKPHGN
jgi:hypothetical protein